MRLTPIFLAVIITFFLFFSCTKKEDVEKHSTPILNTKVDTYISEISKRYNIPGTALAIIKDGEILHKNYYGNANLEHNVPVSDSTVFRVYSLTKPIVATTIFQLIEANKLELDHKISKYLSDVPTSWQSVKIKNLLRHSSGLPEIKVYDKLPEEEAKTKVYKDSIRFTQESRFQYNQTNYWLLLRIIEKLSNKELEDFILENQFKNAAKETVFFSTDSRDIHKNRASLYFPYETGKMQTVNHYRKDYLTSANGLNINLDEFINWDSRFSKNQLISNTSKHKMWEAKRFENDSRTWTYGWNKHILNVHNSYGFSGSMITVYRCFPKDNLSIIYLTNGFEHWYNIENVVNHLAYLADNDIVDFKVLTFEKLLASAQNNDLKNELERLKSTPNYNGFSFEETLNTIGYIFLNNYNNIEKATEVFKLNTQEYPNSSNTYDSLGEAFELKGNIGNAIKNYTKAKELSNDTKYHSQVNKKINTLMHH